MLHFASTVSPRAHTTPVGMAGSTFEPMSPCWALGVSMYLRVWIGMDECAHHWSRTHLTSIHHTYTHTYHGTYLPKNTGKRLTTTASPPISVSHRPCRTRQTPEQRQAHAMDSNGRRLLSTARSRYGSLCGNTGRYWWRSSRFHTGPCSSGWPPAHRNVRNQSNILG